MNFIGTIPLLQQLIQTLCGGYLVTLIDKILILSGSKSPWYVLRLRVVTLSVNAVTRRPEPRVVYARTITPLATYKDADSPGDKVRSHCDTTLAKISPTLNGSNWSYIICACT